MLGCRYTTRSGLILSPNSHKPTKISKLYEHSANGARRRPCEAHMGYTPVLSRLRRESLPLATIWSFYLHLAGEPKNHKLRAGETLTGVCGSFYDPDGGISVLAWADFLPRPLHPPRQESKCRGKFMVNEYTNNLHRVHSLHNFRTVHSVLICSATYT